MHDLVPCRDIEMWKACPLAECRPKPVPVMQELVVEALGSGSLLEAQELAQRLCDAEPLNPAGYLLRAQAHLAKHGAPEQAAQFLQIGLLRCAGLEVEELQEAISKVRGLHPEEADEEGINYGASGSDSQRIGVANVTKRSLPKGAKLLQHEVVLVQSGKLTDITHAGSSSVWLSAPSLELVDTAALGLVYRPMSDRELLHLLQHGVLPGTQPYQTIVEGQEGRAYAEKYLRGHKSVDTHPTTVVEFCVPAVLIDKLWGMQSKNEDGAISHGLGNKGGCGLPHFNACLSEGTSSFRIVMVKRPLAKPRK